MNIREYIDKAIREGKTITIKYIKFDGTQSTRTISNIQYSDEFGEEYIKAYCHLREEERTFKISRIISADGITNIRQMSEQTYRKQKTAYLGNSTKTTSSSRTMTTLHSKAPTTPSQSSFNSYDKRSIYLPIDNKTTNNSTHTQSKSTSEGCYIATMAYGDYNHPKVIALRRFRDNILLQIRLGRMFVKFYYWISPKLVKILKGHDFINSYIRKALDIIVHLISKQ